jgi:hypothetical protein
MTGEHASQRLMTRYVRGDDTIPGDQLWALEAHLEGCAVCRGLLAATDDTAVTAVRDIVWTALKPQLAVPPAVPPRRWTLWLATWASPAFLSWLGATLLVAALLVAYDRVISLTGGRLPLVVLVAPALPLLGVFASWSRGFDPVLELIAATPRAGLQLLLRRTVAVLVVVVPVLLAGGLLTGASIAQLLLPSLAFTTGTLALGSLIGLGRAAAAMAVLWTATFIVPWFASTDVPYVLRPTMLPLWAVAFAVGTAVVVARRGSYTRLNSTRK